MVSSPIAKYESLPHYIEHVPHTKIRTQKPILLTDPFTIMALTLLNYNDH